LKDLKFNRIDLWVIDKQDNRRLYASYKDEPEAKASIDTRKFKRLLKKIKSVDIITVYDKVEETE